MDSLRHGIGWRASAAIIAAAGLAIAGFAFIAIAGTATGTADRQQVRQFKFTSERPGTATGVKSRVTFASEGPETGVATILTRLHRGAEIDTTVPERCAASDEELVAQGRAACPPGSEVGGGLVEVAELGTGDLTLFNAEEQTIFLTEFRNSGIRAVGRESTGRTHRIDLPEGITIERTLLVIERIREGGENYIGTPERCPRTEKWVNRAAFVYRDGVDQRERKSTPCERGSG